MTTVAVIPARLGSARFPGKPLAKQTGKFLIQHVCEAVSRSTSIDQIIVATDDQRIIEAVGSFGGVARMTREDHPTGTARVAQVVHELGLTHDDLVLNVQGDEPEIDPAALDLLVARMRSTDHACRIGTLASPFDDAGPTEGPGSPADPNCVKVVVDESGRAMYFSRSLVPYPQDTSGCVDRPSRWLLHLGVYAYYADTLLEIAAKDSSASCGGEEFESLEQLSWLEQGMPIVVERVSHHCVGIDTPEDYAAFVQRMTQLDRSTTSAV